MFENLVNEKRFTCTTMHCFICLYIGLARKLFVFILFNLDSLQLGWLLIDYKQNNNNNDKSIMENLLLLMDSSFNGFLKYMRIFPFCFCTLFGIHKLNALYLFLSMFNFFSSSSSSWAKINKWKKTQKQNVLYELIYMQFPLHTDTYILYLGLQQYHKRI